MDILLLFDYLPQELRNIAYKMPQEFRMSGEEIRLRVNLPMTAHLGGRAYQVLKSGELADSGGVIITREILDCCFDRFTKMSPYAFAEELSEGYITVEGGHRIGICGKKSGGMIREITSVNMRIAREVKGCSDGVFDKLLPFNNTLVISPPGAGKTTLLRDVARRLSDMGTKVAVADERCEIGACFRGVPQHDVGVNTDILSGFPISDAVMMLLRTMSPQVIVTDELGSAEDYATVCAMTKAGVKILASAHGNSREEVCQRLGKMTAFFKNYVIIDNMDGSRNVRIDS